MSYETPLIKRLRGEYGIGPANPGGEPEMGYRTFPVPPINIEAADEIARLTAEVERLRARCERLRDLAADASSGMVYIEGAHGRLYGVGWDRVRDKRILCEQYDDLKESNDA